MRGFCFNLNRLGLFKDWLSNSCKRFFCHDKFLWSRCWSRLLNGFLNLLFNLDGFILNNFKGSF